MRVSTYKGMKKCLFTVMIMMSVFLCVACKGSTENPVTVIEADGSMINNDSMNADMLVENTAGSVNTSPNEAETNISEIENLPVFHVPDIEALQLPDTFSLEDSYITSRYAASNHFYIDESGVLYGTGSNEFGQLGTGSYGMEEYYKESVKIAENVISVDASWNGYFCIYLTESGELYGMGSNHAGLLLGEGSEESVFSDSDYQKVTTPVLLMENVIYARAGRECIVALKEDKTAYWWGQYAPLTHTSAATDFTDYWKVEEDTSNPLKMLAVTPMKIMENCRYITTGTFTGAAISEDGELYTWGLNIFGECGTKVTDDDFVRTPQKVKDNVKMVWVDKISFSDPKSAPPEFIRRDMDFLFNTFILTDDNSVLAAGENLGQQEKVTEVNGDLIETETHYYSDTFVPIRVMEYSKEANLEILKQLTYGMTRDDVEKLLDESGLDYFFAEEDGEAYLCIEDSRYYCYFDKQNIFDKLRIQEGTSRDGRFALEMELAELEKIVNEAGGTLLKENDEEAYDMYSYFDTEQGIRYMFYVYENKITVIWEIVLEICVCR